MARGWTRVTQVNPDGSVVMEDGTEMQMVRASNGALGLRTMRPGDREASAEAGIDQHAIPDKVYFDTSGLDQVIPPR